MTRPPSLNHQHGFVRIGRPRRISVRECSRLALSRTERSSGRVSSFLRGFQVYGRQLYENKPGLSSRLVLTQTGLEAARSNPCGSNHRRGTFGRLPRG